MSERPFEDKVHLLMEETGCEQGEAELALASAGYDVEKAVRAIAGLLRHIAVLKGKFAVPSKSLYGLFIMIADTRRESLFRSRAVVSYNPALYETPLEGDWYEVEKTLYAFRLGEGTLQQVSQDLEKLLGERWSGAEGAQFYPQLREGRMEPLMESGRRLVAAHFMGEAASLALARQELNLDQFRRVRREDDKGLPAPLAADGAAEGLVVKVSLEEDPAGVPAAEVQPGDSLHALLVDERDIAQYLAKLLGGRSPQGLKSLPAPVESVTAEDGALTFRLRLSGSILGAGKALPEARLKVTRPAADASWWRRLLTFGR